MASFTGGHFCFQGMKRYRTLIVVLLIIAFLPFCYVCLYALPYADDFCIGWELMQGKPLLTSIADQYLYWNGRYTSDVLINLHPIATGSLAVYSLVVFISLLATPFVYYLFLQVVVKQRAAAVIASLLFTLLYFNYMPQLAEGIYWYGGVVNYHLGALALLLQLRFFIQLYTNAERKGISYGFSLLLLILSVGFNEVAALLIPLFYAVVFAYSYKGAIASRRLVAIHLVLAVMAACFVVLSPGNATRLGQFSNHYDLLNSFTKSAGQTLRFSGTWLFTYPVLVCSILTMHYAPMLRGSILAKVDWRIALAGAFGVIFIAAFVPYFATGILGQHRTMNYVYPFFILLWFMAVVCFANRYAFHIALIKAKHVKVVLLVSAIMLMQVSSNISAIYRDLRFNTFAKYKAEYIARQQQILNGPNGVKPLVHMPNSLAITDASYDSSYWVNGCMQLYYTSAKVPLR
mgnify:CR=1 FL=1